MKHRTLKLAVCLALAIWVLPPGTPHAAERRAKAPAHGPSLVFDVSDGRVLLAEDADLSWYPASLTKLMTAYIVFDLLDRGVIAPESQIVISAEANAMPKSRIGLGAGRRITVRQALDGLIIHSANDFAHALAEGLAGSEEDFVAAMNEAALQLGMTRTQFANAHGLPKDGQATTARDMGLLARAIIKRFPDWTPLFAQESASIGRRTVHTHNKILDLFDGADGMKTGFTCGAGYNLVASATRDGRKIVAVLLGDRDGGQRSARAIKLLEAGFATPRGGTIDAKSIEPEPVSGEELVDASLFAPARNISEMRSIKNCFAPAGPPAKLVKDLADRTAAQGSAAKAPDSPVKASPAPESPTKGPPAKESPAKTDALKPSEAKSTDSTPRR